jgi:hypothetical protein
LDFYLRSRLCDLDFPPVKANPCVHPEIVSVAQGPQNAAAFADRLKAGEDLIKTIPKASQTPADTQVLESSQKIKNEVAALGKYVVKELGNRPPAEMEMYANELRILQGLNISGVGKVPSPHKDVLNKTGNQDQKFVIGVAPAINAPSGSRSETSVETIAKEGEPCAHSCTSRL